ncbi:hypothetical protein HGB07_09095 [Candidatus Roizmanbacteria bacterium]|nr:hypothetical protein [Candidatus Roizmanbacteria bacterium]
MALEKEIALDNGISVDYIRISDFQGNKESCIITVALYVNKKARENGRGCVEQRNIRLVGNDNPLKADCV